MFMDMLQAIGALQVAGRKRVKNVEVGKVQLLDVLHQPYS